MSASATLYRGFRIHYDPDGLYAETDGGTCLGPFESHEEVRAAVDRDLMAWPNHGEVLRLEIAMEWGFRAAEKGWNLEQSMIEFRKLAGGS